MELNDTIYYLKQMQSENSMEKQRLRDSITQLEINNLAIEEAIQRLKAMQGGRD